MEPLNPPQSRRGAPRPAVRDGDDPQCEEIIIIIFIKEMKPNQPDIGPVQLCFLWERINKPWQAQAPGGEQIPNGDMMHSCPRPAHSRTEQGATGIVVVTEETDNPPKMRAQLAARDV